MDGRCQIMALRCLIKDLTWMGVLWQRTRKLRCTLSRRKEYLRHWVAEATGQKADGTGRSVPRYTAKPLKSGDFVRVRTQREIRQTLNRWNQLRGCTFMNEMWKYCNTTQKVLRRVEKILDENDYLVKSCSGIVLLEGLMCEGTRGFGRCDRCCHFFWREEWLEKLEETKSFGFRPQERDTIWTSAPEDPWGIQRQIC